MIRDFAVAVGAGALLVMKALEVSAQEPPEIAWITSVTGSVIAQDSGQPISGASVWIELRGREVVRAATDASGQFRMEGEFNAGITPEVVRATAVGFLPETYRLQLGCSEVVSVRGQPGYCRKEVTVHMQEARGVFEPSAHRCTLVGQVTLADGAPAPHSLVRLEDQMSGTTSDEEGQFSIPDVASGIRLVAARAVGTSPHQRLVLVSCMHEGGPSTTKFRLFPVAIW